ncbi:hypothetical protein EV672_10779 [Aquabacterium commune]|uniref:Uncharacterized protein n=1 Tax=Aquabacterium commune TaxID=70586 RepID=A0A4V3CV95_9BURK|nr:hypothetical protein [Aquabacterium commune]TDP81648.1 hypothetical protein EV672_10779 [Aquabacterium commune]
MKNLIAKLFGSGSEPSELERVILTAVRKCLSPGAVPVWDKQLQAVNKIQRLPDGVEVNFYRMEKGKATFDPAISFPNKTEELLLAKVRLRVDGAGQQLEASVWVVGGFVFSIEYGAGSKYFEEILGADPPVEMEVTCQLLCDPSIEQ